VLAQESALAPQFVDTAKQLSCSQDTDCVIAATDTACPQIVNATAAQGYLSLRASAQFEALRSQQSTLGCTTAAACTPPTGAPACVNGQCTAAPAPTCDSITAGEGALLAEFVDESSQYNCQTAADCTVANGPGFCGHIIVNKTAAAGYAAYLASAQFMAYENEYTHLQCPRFMGTCVSTAGTLACTNGRCLTMF
jgi:hypothetical protein